LFQCDNGLGLLHTLLSGKLRLQKGIEKHQYRQALGAFTMPADWQARTRCRCDADLSSVEHIEHSRRYRIDADHILSAQRHQLLHLAQMFAYTLEGAVCFDDLGIDSLKLLFNISLCRLVDL